jgi:Icc-related predicted phosphoesterase
MQKICADVLRQCCFKMKDGDSSIVLTHYAPLVPPISEDPDNGEGWAYDCITKVIDAIRPILVVNGHLHSRLGSQSEYNGTLIDFPPKEGRMHTIDLDTMRLV